MQKLELFTQGFIGPVTLIALSLFLIIYGLRWYLRKANKKQVGDHPDWLRQKNLVFDPLKHHGAFFQIGLITALSLTLLAFNWTPKNGGPHFEAGQIDYGDVIDTQEIPRTMEKPKVIPPPPVTIEAIPDDELIEDLDTFVDQTINLQDEIILTKPKPKPLPPKVEAPKLEDEKEEEIFIRVEKMPTFPGCEGESDQAAAIKCTEQQLFKYIFANLTYPAIARENGITGNVYLSFIIDKHGKIDQIKLLRDIGGGCGDAAVEAIEKMQKEIKFNPGQQGYKPVSVQYSLPIKFRLQ
ncbi:MAG: energy transducer TonB [Saprospiraceae bacterium]